MGLRGFSAILSIVGFFSVGSVQAQNAVSTKLGDRVAGEEVFIKCSGCHQVGPGAKNSIGPELNGIVGRLAGSKRDYEYSAAMKDAKLHWDYDHLAAFVADAKQAVPGTKMSFAGLKNRQDIEDVIAYLSQFDSEGNTK